MKFSFIKSLKFQIGLALAGQFIFLGGVVGFTLYEIDLRKHDYAILNLSGQLRVLGQSMVRNSASFLSASSSGNISTKGSKQSAEYYRKELKAIIGKYSMIIKSFKEKKLAPELTGNDDILYCSWDHQSITQLDKTAFEWDNFLQGTGLDRSENLKTVASYILQNETTLLSSSNDLTRSFQYMMEGKLAFIRRLLEISLAVSVIIGLIVLTIFYYKIIRPMNRTVDGFDRIGRGDLHYQIPVMAENEIGLFTRMFNRMFNRMTLRLGSLFQLTNKINQARNLDDTLKFVYQEFHTFLPIDWVGWLQKSPGGLDYNLDRVYTDIPGAMLEGEKFHTSKLVFSEGTETVKPITIENSVKDKESFAEDHFIHALSKHGLASIIVLPQKIAGFDAMLVFASQKPDSYNREHTEFLKNIANQISHSFEKTIGMESLVISAVEGLAKLAESRDSETGDHLYRMSLYSAIISEEMGKEEEYKEVIDTAFIRQIHRFAPMHDIGKVGIEDRILLKPGKLTEEERKDMQLHPVIGADVLRKCESQMNQVGFSIFQMGIEIAESHHEKFDGSGYPHRKRGKEIPLSARIVSAADVFDALTSKRPYKDAWPIEKAIELMQSEAGSAFDPQVIAAMEKSLPRILEVYNKYKHV